MRITTLSAGLIGLALLSACDEQEVILPGERLGAREILDDGAATEAAGPNRSAPAAISAAQGNADWAQSPVSPFARIDNAALGASLVPVLSVDIGEGDSRRQRLNVDPVVAGGRIYTMDSAFNVSAHSTAGALLWQKSMVPLRDEARQAQGGGLAVADGRLYVTSGFGRVAALDPATGAELWTQRLGNTATGAPTVTGGLVYLTSGDSRGWAIEADSGRIRWQIDSIEDIHNVAGAPAPAVNDKFVVFGFGQGTVQGAFRQGGLRMWNADLVGSRNGSALATVTDLTGDPLIAGNRVYVGNHSGRVAAFDVNNGDRLWTARMGASGPVWPSGNSVFLVSDVNQLVRLDAETGEQIWAVDLPGYEPVRKPQTRRDTAFFHHGPIIAGGRLIVASSDGLLRSFNPADGGLISAIQIPKGATTRPVVAGGTLYVVNKDGTLLGYR